jgi:hypothetical protein
MSDGVGGFEEEELRIPGSEAGGAVAGDGAGKLPDRGELFIPRGQHNG